MNSKDILSLSEKAREDGERLFGVCEFIYSFGIGINWIIGLLGLVGGFISFKEVSYWLGGSVLLATLAFCFFIYVITVLFTHFGKVMVHTSFANLAIIEHLTSSKFNDNEETNKIDPNKDHFLG